MLVGYSKPGGATPTTVTTREFRSSRRRAEYRRITREPAAPQRVAENRDRRSALMIVVSGTNVRPRTALEPSTGKKLPVTGEMLTRKVWSPSPNRLRPRFDTDRPRNLLERSRLFSKALEVPRRERQRSHALTALPPEHDDALLVEKWQRPTQHGIGDAEDCDGQADAARENENDCGRRFRLADHSAPAKPQVIASVVQPGRHRHADIIGPRATARRDLPRRTVAECGEPRG